MAVEKAKENQAKVLQEALALPAESRSEIAEALLRSLEPEADDGETLTEVEWNAAWAAELKRRHEDVEAGREELIPEEEVYAELEAKYLPR